MLFSIVEKNFPDDMIKTIFNFEPKKTKHHNESYLTHSNLTGYNMDKIMKSKYPEIYKKYDFPILEGKYNIFYVIGFFHDIGKPFAFRNKGKKSYQIMNGHAQIGAYIFRQVFKNKIQDDLLDMIVYCIDNHMLKNFIYDIEYESKYHYILETLLEADNISRDSSCINRNVKLNVNNINRNFGKIIVFPIGLQSSGKTSLSKKLLKLYSSIIHIERDSLLVSLSPYTDYDECYKYIYSDEKRKNDFQKLYYEKIENALLSDVKIIIIDSVMNCYQKSLNNLFNSLKEEAINEFNTSFKIGMFLFSQYQLNNINKSDCKVLKFYPDDSLDFPKVKGELNTLESTDLLDIGTGCYQNLLKIINKQSEKINDQKLMITLLQEKSLSDVLDYFHGSVFSVEEFKNVYSINYKEGLQTVSGITKDTRGEIVYFKDEKYYLLRASYPVFSEINDLNESLFEQNFNKIIIEKKYDGSLVNILYISKDDILYDDILKISNNNNYIKTNGLYLIGSRSKLIIKDEYMLSKIEDCNLKEVIDKLESFISSSKNQYTRINFQFEIMTNTYQKELTVYYKVPFYKLLSYIVFNDNEKHIKVPSDIDNINKTNMYEFKTLDDSKNFIDSNYNKLINGDLDIEPEGYVLYFIYDNKVVLYKYKYKEYYVAHKPHKNPYNTNLALSSMSDEYKNRFLKFRNLKDVNDIKDSFCKDFLKVQDIINMYSDDRKQLFSSINNNKDLISTLEEHIINYRYNIKFIDKEKVSLIKFIMNNYKNENLLSKIIDNFFIS